MVGSVVVAATARLKRKGMEGVVNEQGCGKRFARTRDAHVRDFFTDVRSRISEEYSKNPADHILSHPSSPKNQTGASIQKTAIPIQWRDSLAIKRILGCCPNAGMTGK